MQTDMSLGKDNGAMVLNSNRRIDKVVVIDALNRCRWREVT